MSRTRIGAIAAIVMAILGALGYNQFRPPAPYWEAGQDIELRRNIYTEPFDPCDPIYMNMAKPSKLWGEKYGTSERSVIAYQIALGRQQRGELRAMIYDVNDMITQLKAGGDITKRVIEFEQKVSTKTSNQDAKIQKMWHDLYGKEEK